MKENKQTRNLIPDEELTKVSGGNEVAWVCPECGKE